eukprot:1588960-Rhodomonas_salina.1
MAVDGASIHLEGSALELSSSTLTDGQARADGGGIGAFVSSMLWIKDLTVGNCSAGSRGGAVILTQDGQAQLEGDVTFHDNA